MPAATILNVLVNLAIMTSPRRVVEGFNWPELIIQLGLLVLGYVALIKSVKTVLLFSCLAYFSFGIMYAY